MRNFTRKDLLVLFFQTENIQKIKKALHEGPKGRFATMVAGNGLSLLRSWRMLLGRGRLYCIKRFLKADPLQRRLILSGRVRKYPEKKTAR